MGTQRRSRPGAAESTDPTDRSPVARDRRMMLKAGARAIAAAGVAGGTGALMLPRHVQAADPIRSTARIVIAGAGAAGLATAARLTQRLDGAKIIIVDPRADHYYQPGYTLVGAGLKPAAYSVSPTRDYVPSGVEWVQAGVAEFDPEAKRIVTDDGRSIPYDFLVVATGMRLAYERIDGMEERLIGTEGIGSIYRGPDAAWATWQQMSAFADKGGTGLFLRPATEMKCAGAPLKYTLITEDYLTRRGNRGKARLVYNANNKSLFGVPIVAERLRMLFQERGIEVNHDRVLQAIDPGRRIATFTTPVGTEEQGYDFIHVVPPMEAPAAILRSPLPWRNGPWQSEGWLEVDKHTLRHVRYPNVFGVGDIAGVPKGKTAASVKWQVPVAVDHLVATIASSPTDARYDGYTSCPLITRLGRAMLIEFDYQNNLVPSFPGVIAPLEELWISWVMETMALKPTYISMLRGRA